MSKRTWHGLQFEQWLKMWDYARWREQVAATLKEVALCRRADPRERIAAVQTLNVAVVEGTLLPDPSMPEFITGVMLEIISTGGRVGFFGRRTRKRMRAKFLAARWMCSVGSQLRAYAEADQQAEEQKKVEPSAALSS